MKKYLLLFLFITGFILAYGRKCDTIIENIAGVYHLSKHDGQQTELQLSGQTNVATPLYRAVKKITEGIGWHSTVLARYMGYVSAFQKTNNNRHSKNYLSHIHPSHHFW
ncbi:MAG: hypothetical protein WDO71_12930 [Bacteroidota bacterium]